MTVITEVIWAAEHKDQPAVVQRGNDLQSLQTAPAVITTDPATQNLSVVRHWVDMPAADSWIEFVSAYSPASASIIT